MAMVKRATGKIEKFTDAEGDEVKADEAVVWADDKDKPVVKDVLDVPLVVNVDLDIDATDDGDDVVAKDC
jgi:hypothetical protein